MSERRRQRAIELFAPLGPTYDRVGAVLSLGQDPRWRRFLVGRLPRDGGHVLDVATGTGLVAEALLQRGFRVTGLDQSTEMLGVATPPARRPRRARAGQRRRAPVRERVLRPPHVHVPAALRRRPGARRCASWRGSCAPAGRWRCSSSACRAGVWHPLWRLYVGAVLPLAGRLLSPGWHEVGRFLGGSIRGSGRGFRRSACSTVWREAGIADAPPAAAQRSEAASWCGGEGGSDRGA